MTTTTEGTERSDSQQDFGTLVNVTAGNKLAKPTTKLGRLDPQAGKVAWAILWLLGVPLPVLLIVDVIWGR